MDVGMISHVGGHAFAGNVIVYVPPNYTLLEKDGVASPLAGMGIWYGRVEPKHVLGILDETVREGNIIGELWRGGMQIDTAEPPVSLAGRSSMRKQKPEP